MNKKKLLRTIVIVGCVAVVVGIFEAIVNIIPPEKVIENNVFIKDPDAKDQCSLLIEGVH